MKTLKITEIPEDYHDLYANKIYHEITQEKILYDKKTINEVIDIFAQSEEYEKCKKLKEINEN